MTQPLNNNRFKGKTIMKHRTGWFGKRQCLFQFGLTLIIMMSGSSNGTADKNATEDLWERWK